jgi:hypothetical protein
MRVGSEYSFIEFTFSEAEPENPSGLLAFAYSVDVSCDGFRGRIERVWLSQDDITQFLTGLQQFEEKRKGLVSLTNMSSLSEANPLTFEIFSVDEVGHLTARANLQKIHYVGDDPSLLKLSVSFDIDAGQLPTIVGDFRKLFNDGPERI